MALFDNLAKTYDSWFYENELLFKSELDAINYCFIKDLKTLDIGCGTGIFMQALKIEKGLDPSKEMLEIAKMRNLDVYNGSTTNLQVKKGEYELMTMITVDCFIENLDESFKNISNSLNVGGYFLIAFLNKATPLGEVYEKSKKDNPYYEHAFFHTGKEIIKGLEENGFKVLKKCNTVKTLENLYQPYEEGFTDGVFSVLLARKDR